MALQRCRWRCLFRSSDRPGKQRLPGKQRPVDALQSLLCCLFEWDELAYGVVNPGRCAILFRRRLASYERCHVKRFAKLRDFDGAINQVASQPQTGQDNAGD